jgi:nicotinamide phosphoribosyltransferase
MLRCLEILGNKFGYSVNGKCYKELNSKVRLIQGDGITRLTPKQILLKMKENGWAANNISFGSGGGLLQKMDRDTCKFAFKCSAVEVEGEFRPVFKDPVTDKGKVSKKGFLKLAKVAGAHGYSYTTFSNIDDKKQYKVCDTELKVRFENGVMFNKTTLDKVRARCSH